MVASRIGVPVCHFCRFPMWSTGVGANLLDLATWSADGWVLTRARGRSPALIFAGSADSVVSASRCYRRLGPRHKAPYRSLDLVRSWPCYPSRGDLDSALWRVAAPVRRSTRRWTICWRVHDLRCCDG